MDNLSRVYFSKKKEIFNFSQIKAFWTLSLTYPLPTKWIKILGKTKATIKLQIYLWHSKFLEQKEEFGRKIEQEKLKIKESCKLLKKEK